MDITFEDVAHVIQDARYQKAILDTTPQPDKRIALLPRNFNVPQFVERYDVCCRTVMAEPLGRWFLHKFADLTEKVEAGRHRGAPEVGELWPETELLAFVESVFELKRRDPGGVIPFDDVLRLLFDYRLDQLPAVSSVMQDPRHSDAGGTLRAALDEAYATFESGDGADGANTADADSWAAGDADAPQRSASGGSKGGEGTPGPAGPAGAARAADAERVVLAGLDDAEAETDVSRYNPNYRPGGATQGGGGGHAHGTEGTAGGGGFAGAGGAAQGTGGRRGNPQTQGVSAALLMRTNLVGRLPGERSVNLTQALEDLLETLCQPLFDRLAADRAVMLQYCRFKLFAMQPIVERQVRYHRVLGQGAFGTVHGCMVAQTGIMLAMKLMVKKRIKLKHSRGQVVAERAALETLARHPSPYCMRLRYAFQTRESYHLVLPLAIGGDLKFHLREGPFEERRAKFYAAEIAVGLGHMHSLGFIMRDLKPRNILLDSDGHVKISDFGLAASIAQGARVKGRAGTEGYWSPEVINGKSYGVDADWWGFGTCVFELLAGFNPFSTKFTGLETRNQGTRLAPIKYPKIVSPAARALINPLLSRDVEQRLGTAGGLDEVMDARRFAFWQGIDLRRIRLGTHPVPWVPEKGQIYAASQSEMLEMDDDVNGQTLRRVKLGPEDVIDFEPFVDDVDHQKDIVAILPKNSDLMSAVDAVLAAHRKRLGRNSVKSSRMSVQSSNRQQTEVGGVPLPPQDACCSIA